MIEEKKDQSKEMIESNIGSEKELENNININRPKEGVALSDIVDHNKNINLNQLETKNDHTEREHGGLKGNPGQLARFNHMMENKSGNMNKYFWSGKK